MPPFFVIVTVIAILGLLLMTLRLESGNFTTEDTESTEAAMEKDRFTGIPFRLEHPSPVERFKL